MAARGSPHRSVRHILNAYPDTDVVSSGGGTFFSCDPATHWPSFAAIVTTDELDSESDLDVDFKALDRLFPRRVIRPLLDEAHERALAAAMSQPIDRLMLRTTPIRTGDVRSTSAARYL